MPIITDDNVEAYAEAYSWYKNDDNENEISMWKNIQMALNKYLAQNGEKSIDDEATKRKNDGLGFNSSNFEFVMRDIDVENDTFDIANLDHYGRLIQTSLRIYQKLYQAYQLFVRN